MSVRGDIARFAFAVLLLGLSLAACSSNRAAGNATKPTPVSSTAPPGCMTSSNPVPVADVPADVTEWASGKPVLGQGALWTVRSAVGLPGRHDGTGWHLKFPWYTRPPNGLPQIAGHRLHGSGTFHFDANRAFAANGAFVTSTLNFSASGCWEITGRYGGSTLRFAVDIGRAH
jgi:hypothetical protein